MEWLSDAGMKAMLSTSNPAILAMLSAGGPPNAPAPAERPPIDISTLDAAGRLLQLKKYVERTLIKHYIFIHTHPV